VNLRIETHSVSVRTLPIHGSTIQA
jgi:hypothetical protein